MKKTKAKTKTFSLFLMCILLVMAMAFLSACGSDTDAGSQSGGAESSAESGSAEDSAGDTAEDEADSPRILVAYFSATGNTETVAEYAADILGADLYEITPQEPYTEEQLAYNTGERCDQEQADPTVRPAIDGQVENMEEYDIVLVGYPIWHGDSPRIISTFLESYNFSGKTMAAFCTSGSTGIDKSLETIKGIAPEDVTWLEGRRFPGGASKDDVQEWLDSLNLIGKDKAPEVGVFKRIILKTKPSRRLQKPTGKPRPR